MIDQIQQRILEEVADLHVIPEGAYNIRANGESAARNTTANIDIINKEDGSGIEIQIKPGTKRESVHIPVVLSKSGIKEVVYESDKYGGTPLNIASKKILKAAGVKCRRMEKVVDVNVSFSELGL